MSCEECKRIEKEGQVIWYRWGKARIGIIACLGHGQEILEVLNDHQEKVQKAEKFRKLIKDPKKDEPG
jgi:hypothetical protein